MTWTSYGYAGTVNAVGWARLAQILGAPYGVTSGWNVTGVAGTRVLQISAGSGFGWGVNDNTDTSETVTCTANGTGARRWDTLVVRRNHSTKVSSFAVVTGTSDNTISPSLTINEGILTEQPLAVIPVDPGVTSFAGLTIYPTLTGATRATVTDGSYPPHAPFKGQLWWTTKGYGSIWDGTAWVPVVDDPPIARTRANPETGDFAFPSSPSTQRVNLAAIETPTGMEVASGRVKVLADGLYRVTGRQRFTRSTAPTAAVTLSARADANGNPAAGTLLAIDWGTVGPYGGQVTLRFDELVPLTAGATVELYRNASDAGTLAGNARFECGLTIELDRRYR